MRSTQPPRKRSSKPPLPKRSRWWRRTPLCTSSKPHWYGYVCTSSVKAELVPPKCNSNFIVDSFVYAGCDYGSGEHDGVFFWTKLLQERSLILHASALPSRACFYSPLICTLLLSPHGNFGWMRRLERATWATFPLSLKKICKCQCSTVALPYNSSAKHLYWKKPKIVAPSTAKSFIYTTNRINVSVQPFVSTLKPCTCSTTGWWIPSVRAHIPPGIAHNHGRSHHILPTIVSRS
jgi:hypothetical protein